MAQPPITANTTHTQPANLVHYPALDGLRAIAFVLVFLTHYYALPWGFAGVNVFFVLSGFLITGILLDTRDRPDRVRRFYVRRALRIFPLYYGIMVLALLAWPWMRWRLSWPWMAWPLYVGNFLRLWGRGTKDPIVEQVTFAWLTSVAYPKIVLYFGHFWSLCVEEQFYLLWPWVIFGIRSRRILAGICIALAVGAPFLRFGAEHLTPVWMTSREFPLVVGVPFQLDALLLGALVALLWRSRWREQMQKLAPVLLGVMVAGGVVYLVHAIGAYGFADFRHTYSYPDWRFTWGLSAVDLMSAVLIVCALRPGSLVYRIGDLKWLRELGRISYGAYVFHDVIHGLLIQAYLHSGLPIVWIERGVMASGFVMTVILASLSYRFFEMPFLQLKERLAPSHAHIVGVSERS